MSQAPVRPWVVFPQSSSAATSTEFPAPPQAQPTCLTSVAAVLLDYLEQRLHAGPLRFAEGPVEIPHGWETYIYRFRLESSGMLPEPFAGPLILRVYASPGGIPRARHEFAVQGHLHARGHAVPKPLLCEEDCSRFGGPFLLMEWLPGETLLERLQNDYTRILQVARQLAEQQVRLHSLSTDGFPAPSGPFLERRLEELEGLVGRHGLVGLRPGLDWLHRHRPAPPAAPCILHLDFHPVNLLVARGSPPAVLDWSDADVGDHHADVATTIMLMRSAPVELSRWSDRLLAPLARWTLLEHYFLAYGWRRRLRRATLRYYLAWAALRRLAVYGMWLRAGPQTNGCKPSLLRFLQSGHIDRLEQCFQQWSGVTASLA